MFLAALFSVTVVCEDLPKELSKAREGLRGSDVLDLHPASEGQVWASTSDGLFLIDQKNGRQQAVRGPTKHWYVSGVTTDKNGMAWTASANGIYTVDLKKGTVNAIIPDTPASSVAVDSKNAVWGATPRDGVVSIVDQKPARWYKTSDGLPSNQVFDVFSSKDGKIWAGTEKGLAVMDGSVWRAVGTPENRAVYSIAEQGGKLFAGTSDGVYFGDSSRALWGRLPGSGGKVITAIAAWGKGLYVGTKDGTILWYDVGDLSKSAQELGKGGAWFSGSPVTSITPLDDPATVLVGSFGAGLVWAHESDHATGTSKK